MDLAFWKGRRVFVTGHTGFKGAWLSEWLLHLGAHVSGFSLAPATDPNLYGYLELDRRMESFLGDIRDRAALEAQIVAAQPEVVFHLAAQALVRKGYESPVETFDTNVMGTVHLLDAVRRAQSVRAVVVVTSDKCYENREWPWGYRENEPLGGNDPYSSSKAAAELVTHAFRSSYFRDAAGVATVRAGNVIGGGDWSPERLVPDLVNAAFSQDPVRLRFPGATRPWQHVLEPLSGYMLLAERLYREPSRYAQAWNFGPQAEVALTVAQVADLVLAELGSARGWDADGSANPHEAGALSVDSNKARSSFGWRARLSVKEAIAWTAAWYRSWRDGQNARSLTIAQIEEYCGR